MDEFDVIHRLLRERRYSQALRRLLGNDGRIRSEFRTDLNHAWYLAGSASYNSDRIDRALGYFKNAARAWPNDSQALMAVANCYSDMDKPRWSVHYLNRAIEIEPKNPDLIYNLANARFDMAQYAEAAKLYRKVIKAAKGNTKKWASKNLERALDRMRHDSRSMKRSRSTTS